MPLVLSCFYSDIIISALLTQPGVPVAKRGGATVTEAVLTPTNESTVFVSASVLICWNKGLERAVAAAVGEICC